MSRFALGEKVRVADRRTLFHSRVPGYIRGHTGVVVNVLNPYVIPEDEAWGRLDGRRETLYRIRFHIVDTWADYRGPSDDTLDIDIFEHWIEPAPERAP